jgi:hypothetical protein
MSWNKCSQLSLKGRSHDAGLRGRASMFLARLRRWQAVCSRTRQWRQRKIIERLVGWLSIGGKRSRVGATVDIIRQHAAGFNAAVTYEIKRHKQEMFEKLLPCFLKMDASQ